MRTHYQNLRVSEDAEPEVIRAAYRALANKWHPDKNPDQAEKAARYMAIINAAYEVLSDPARRMAYDEYLAACREVEEEPWMASDPKTESMSRTDDAVFDKTQKPAANKQKTSGVHELWSSVIWVWQGNEGLGSTFWIYGALVPLIAFFVLVSVVGVEAEVATGLSVIYHLAFVVPSVWRSSRNAESRIWKHAARSVVAWIPLIGFVVGTLAAVLIPTYAQKAGAHSGESEYRSTGLFDDLVAEGANKSLYHDTVLQAYPDINNQRKTKHFQSWLEQDSDSWYAMEYGGPQEVIAVMDAYHRFLSAGEQTDAVSPPEHVTLDPTGLNGKQIADILAENANRIVNNSGHSFVVEARAYPLGSAVYIDFEVEASIQRSQSLIDTLYLGIAEEVCELFGQQGYRNKGLVFVYRTFNTNREKIYEGHTNQEACDQRWDKPSIEPASTQPSPSSTKAQDKQQRAPSKATQSISTESECQFKQVMTDADYEACGLTPP